MVCLEGCVHTPSVGKPCKQIVQGMLTDYKRLVIDLILSRKSAKFLGELTK